MSAPGETTQPASPTDHTHRQASFAFNEYQMLVEDMAKLSDRRQMINTLFVTINTIFLTGVGYLLYKLGQAYGDNTQVLFFAIGFLVIAALTTVFNNAWRRIGGQYSNLVNLRVRYLKQLEVFMRASGFFPVFETSLSKTKKLVEIPPPGIYDDLSEHDDQSATKGIDAWNTAHPSDKPILNPVQPWLKTRGIYTLEDVLYSNPEKRFRASSFTKSEQQILVTFTSAYWAAFGVSLICLIMLMLQYFFHIVIPLGPFSRL